VGRRHLALVVDEHLQHVPAGVAQELQIAVQRELAPPTFQPGADVAAERVNLRHETSSTLHCQRPFAPFRQPSTSNRQPAARMIGRASETPILRTLAATWLALVASTASVSPWRMSIKSTTPTRSYRMRACEFHRSTAAVS